MKVVIYLGRIGKKTIDEITRALKDKDVSLRNKLIVHILLYMGIRAGEIIGIKVANIDFLTSHLKVIGKDGKIREIPIKSELLNLIKKYLDTERKRILARENYLRWH